MMPTDAPPQTYYKQSAFCCTHLLVHMLCVRLVLVFSDPQVVPGVGFITPGALDDAPIKLHGIDALQQQTTPTG